jgi:hypothetical protein
MNKLRWIVGLVVVLMAVFLVGAQADGESCDAGQIAEDLALLVDEVVVADDVSAALLAVHEATLAARMACGGMVFSSAVDGMQPVLGPLTLDEGVYIVTTTTGDYLISETTVLSGECKDYNMGAGYSSGDASDGAQEVWEIPDGGCSVLINITLVDEEWQMVVEKVR